MLCDEYFIINNRKVKVHFEKDGNRYWVTFPFNRTLIDEIKVMEGARWHGFDIPPVKKWTILDSARNRFQIDFLTGKNPYALYDGPLVNIAPTRTVYNHQGEGVRFVYTRKQCILAWEMGSGKSLVAIEVMELSGLDNWWWVAPKSALNATRLELEKWRCKIQPKLFTYDSLKKILESNDYVVPDGVIFDESSRVKTPSAQRSQAALYLANAIREKHGKDGYVILMSGSPAPKSPADWWHQCEIACPGYLREGTSQKFIQRLAVTEMQESMGGKYNRIVAWKDSEDRCIDCGEFKQHADHVPLGVDNADNPHLHPFKPCVNEVAHLYTRMKGLVEVKFKKDCLDLPEKIYKIVKCKPTIGTINAMKMIMSSNMSAIEKLVRCRELSDGFQYRNEPLGHIKCTVCKRLKKYEGNDCPGCNGTGEVQSFGRTYTELPTPKEEQLIDDLDQHDDVGRLVVYAAFTASIDRVEKICKQQQWEVIRVDGRGWKWSGAFDLSQLDMLKTFQEGDKNAFPRVAFVGHPGSAGMGLTLTASPTIIHYSNDFNAESRIQSDDRIHRPGMDVNRGATIIDYIHLPTDQLVLTNLQKKRDLQSITMGELEEAINNV